MPKFQNKCSFVLKNEENFYIKAAKLSLFKFGLKVITLEIMCEATSLKDDRHNEFKYSKNIPLKDS